MCFYVKEEMNEENIIESVDKALDPTKFDLFAYLDGQPVYTDGVTIYVDVKKSKELQKLVESRREELNARRERERLGKAESLGLDESDEDTEYDDQINALVNDLEKSAIRFNTRTVAPALIRAIDKRYVAKRKGVTDEEALEKLETDRIATLFSKAIVSITVGDGTVDDTPWDKDRFLGLEERLYPEQASKLVSHLYEMVYTGEAFDKALSVDF